MGGHFNWHRDSAETGIYANRFCSIVIILNNEYTGGELEINTELNGDESIITLDNSIGNLHVFLSQVLHRVKPIEAGVRYSLVSWFSVKPINNFVLVINIYIININSNFISNISIFLFYFVKSLICITQ